MARPVALIGTGTSVGKTYVAERLLRALTAEGRRGLAYKPIESGFTPGPDSDIARLGRAATFHVKPSLATQTFAAPLSAHLAARLEGKRVNLRLVRSELARASASAADLILFELPGGAFSPLDDEILSAEFLATLPGTRSLLVAPDRLGVLHDVAVATRASQALGLDLLGVVLTAPASPDASTGLNAGEMHRATSIPLRATFPRRPAEAEVTDDDPAREICRFLLDRS